MSVEIVEKPAKVAKIYRLFTPDNEFVYYGSTYSDLRKRLSEHKKDWKRWKDGKCRYITSFKLFETELPIDIVLVEKVTGDKEELKARERYHIENNTCVNKNRPGRTQDEYRDANKDKISEYQKVYQKAYYQNKKVLAENPQNIGE